MFHVTQCRVWLFAAAFLLATPALAVTLQCAHEDELEACTPLVIWSMFQYDYRNESNDSLDNYLSQAEQQDLGAQLESGHQAATAGVGDWEGKLPPADAIVWQLLTGKLGAPAAAEAARLLEAQEDRTAVLTTLTWLAHEPALAAAMEWTLSAPRERWVTLGWMLSAGNTAARDWAVDLLLQCSRDHTAGCADDLPEGPLLSPEQLPGIWPKLSPEYQVAALVRMRLDGLESFLRGELLAEEGADRLYRAWGLASGSYGPYEDARVLLASLIMERLLDPHVAQEARFQRPIDAPSTGGALTFDTLEDRAWRYVVSRRGAESVELWRAQSRSANPWVALMGVAGLVAIGHEHEVTDELASLIDAQGAPPAELLKLLGHVDQPTVDQLFLLMFSKPPGDIGQACAAVTRLSSERADRLASELGGWAQQVLAAVPVSELPPLEQIDPTDSDDSLPEPMRSAACITDAVMRVGKENVTQLKPLATFLSAHEAPVFQLIGALLSLQWDDLEPLAKLLDRISTSTHPALKKMHREMAIDLAGLRRIAAMKGTDEFAVTAACENEMALKGVAVETLVAKPWSVERTGTKQVRMSLNTTTLAGDRLTVVCDVDIDPRPNVIMLSLSP